MEPLVTYTFIILSRTFFRCYKTKICSTPRNHNIWYPIAWAIWVRLYHFPQKFPVPWVVLSARQQDGWHVDNLVIDTIVISSKHMW